jgi:large subunit ribosomal protein L24
MNKRGTRRCKIKKGDQVIVIAGRDRNKRGRVLEVLPDKGKVRVEGIAIVKRHERANRATGRGGGIIEKEALIDISNVQLIDPETGKPTRVRYQINEDGTKTRIAVRSGAALDKA